MRINLSDRRLWLLIFGGILILHLLTLLRYPPPFVDEAWLVSRAWAFKDTGHQFGPLDAGLGEQFAGIWTLNQWLITVLQSSVLRFFAQPELLPLRALSLVEGFGLLVVSYWTTNRLSGKTVAICSTLLLALSRIFFHTAHMARYDILATFLVYSALAIIVNDRRGRFWVGLAAGLLAGLAVETHLNTLIFFPAFALYFVLEYRFELFRMPNTWGFALGTGLGAAFYLFLHVLQYPDTYFKVNKLLYSKTQTPPVLSGNLQSLLQGFENVGFLLLLASGAMILLSLLAISLLIRRNEKAAWQLLGINITLWIGAALLFPNSMGHYAIYLAPACLWLAAEFLVDTFRKPWQGRPWDYASRSLILGVLVAELALTSKLLIPNGYQDYQRAQAKVDAAVKPGDTIIGSQVYWLGLYDHPYYSWELLFLYSRFYPGTNLEDALQYFRPDILVIDGYVDPYINDTLDPAERWYDYRISRKELFDYLATHAKQVSMPDNVTYADRPVQVYRLIWNP